MIFPFPILTTAHFSPPLSCGTAVVGGGLAGVYAAWRLVVDAKSVPPSDVCLFEARKAVGGRTYSVDVQDLTLDIGAYRFGKGMHLPGDLIQNVYNLSLACYEPSCTPDPEFNQVLYKIVDADGHNAGYATPIRRMLKDLEDAKVRIYYDHELTGLYDTAEVAASSKSTSLHFAGGATAVADAVLLNLPRVAIERLDPLSILFEAGPKAPAYQILRNCTPCTDGSGGGSPSTGDHLAVKVYAIYDDPWWVSKLGLREGNFADVSANPPLVGRYHDGPILHDKKSGALGKGALEAVYTFSFIHPEISWYVPFAANPAGEPLTVTTDPTLLNDVHQRLMAFHKAAFQKVGINASTVPAMTTIALGVWTSDKYARGLTNPASANLHWQMKSASCPAEPCLATYTPQTYNKLIGTPNSNYNVHLANNDYSWTGDDNVPCCWAEQSLKSVERTLHQEWGLARPKWLDEKYWDELITE